MFKLFKPRRHDPEAIANVVLESATDADILAGFWKEFAISEDRHPRILFSVVIFAYCWILGWVTSTKDGRVSEAYERAARIIALRFKDAAKLVRVSDYVPSELEISEFYFDVSKHFGSRSRSILHLIPRASSGHLAMRFVPIKLDSRS